MDATTAMQLTQSSVLQALRGARRPLSLHVAMLAQQSDMQEEPAATDVMVYRQPASDVPVPACWDPPAAPKQPLPDRIVDTDSEDAPNAGSPTAGAFEPVDLEPVSILQSSAWTGPQVAAWVLSSVVTCSLVGTVLLA